LSFKRFHKIYIILIFFISYRYIEMWRHLFFLRTCIYLWERGHRWPSGQVDSDHKPNHKVRYLSQVTCFHTATKVQEDILLFTILYFIVCLHRTVMWCVCYLIKVFLRELLVCMSVHFIVCVNQISQVGWQKIWIKLVFLKTSNLLEHIHVWIIR
jgi:hypothetical protein